VRSSPAARGRRGGRADRIGVLIWARGYWLSRIRLRSKEKLARPVPLEKSSPHVKRRIGTDATEDTGTQQRASTRATGSQG
jgi:hypothetical protein